MRCLGAGILACSALLSSCAERPAAERIVLHPQQTERHVAHRTPTPPRKPVTTTANAAGPTLTAAQKEKLFRDFETYLEQPGHDE